MAEQLSPEELASFKELLMPGMIEIQTIAQLFFEKGIIKQRVHGVKAYSGRNPKTGEPTSVKPKKLPFFKCGKELRERVDS